MFTVSGKRVRLRPLASDDLPRLISWNHDPEVNRYIEGDYPTTEEEAEAWLRRLRSDRHAQSFAVVTLDGELIGDIGLSHITWRSGEAELHVRIGERQLWDQGYGTDAVTSLLCHAFAQMTLNRVYLRVYKRNLRALRCYEKAGFRKEGRLVRRSGAGEAEEVILMYITRDEHRHGRLMIAGLPA